MFKRLSHAVLICFFFFAAGELHADSEANAKKIQIVMGGSVLGIRNATQQDMEVAFNAAVRDFLKSTNTDLKIRIYSSTKELYAAFDRREIDGLFGTAIEYLGREDQLGKDIMAVGYSNAGVKQSYVVIVRKDDGVSKLSDLKGRRITLAQYQDIEEVYLNTLLLRDNLSEIPIFFSQRLYAKNPNIAIMDVFFNKSDITIVRDSEYKTAIELNPQLERKLIILNKSLPYIPAAGSVRKEIPSASIAELMRAIEKYGEADGGKKVLSFSQASSIQKISMKDIQSTRDLLNEYQSLKKIKTPSSSGANKTTKEHEKRNTP